jgi:cytochrome c-type biogenesis protein CcmH
MTRSLLIALFLLSLLSSLVTAQVVIEDKPSDDPVVEQRLAKLSHELRCLKCQNQTLADSPSSIAADLRREIREQIQAGKSDKEILAFLTQRYGDFILYRPRVTPLTYLLWFGPFVLLIAGLIVLFRYVRQRRDAIKDQPLSAEERRRAEEMLRS